MRELNVPAEHCSALAAWNTPSDAWDLCRDGASLMWLARALANDDQDMLISVAHAHVSMFEYLEEAERVASAEGRSSSNSLDPFHNGYASVRHDIGRASGHEFGVRPWSFHYGYNDDVGMHRASAQNETADVFRDRMDDARAVARRSKTRRDFLRNSDDLTEKQFQPLPETPSSIYPLDCVLDVRWHSAPPHDLFVHQVHQVLAAVGHIVGARIMPEHQTIYVSQRRDAADTDALAVHKDNTIFRIGSATLTLQSSGSLKLCLLGQEILPGDEAKKFAQRVSDEIASRKAQITANV